MTSVRRRLHPAAWLSLLALLALAVLPTVSHALAFARGADRAWTEVCTAQGMKLVAVEAGDEAPRSSASAHLEHCPLCHLGGGDAALVAVAEPVGIPVATDPSPSFAPPPPPRPSDAWAVPHPRAPPACG